MDLKQEIKNYIPFNEQEEKDKELFLEAIETFEHVLTRDSRFAHFSSSAFVVNPTKTKMLVVYHNIFDGWIYPGGHADGEEDLLSVALREVEEETGLSAKVLEPHIFSLQALPTKGHVKRGKYVSAHDHLDVVYLLEADDTQKLAYREEESQGVKWIPLEEAQDSSMVDFIRPIHAKLIQKMKIKSA